MARLSRAGLGLTFPAALPPPPPVPPGGLCTMSHLAADLFPEPRFAKAEAAATTLLPHFLPWRRGGRLQGCCG